MVTQFPMEICESIGLLKVDFLGLSTLTIMRKACELIERYHGIHYDLSNIPYRPDPETPEINDMLVDSFKMLSRGETIGVFQLESQGMRRMLTDMRPHKFEHIVAAVALYRPGPMDYIPTYNKRLHGEEPVVYHHPQLENILSETYGICVYQEQIMQIGAALFGYSLGEADLMRRAVSKKKKEDLQKHRATFEQRGPEHGVDPETANKIFDDIEFFARYGFNKCLPGDVEVIDAATGRLVRIEDLANGTASIEHTITCDTGNLTLKSGHVSAVMDNGVKPVYRLRTWSGNEIEATANHPFYTQEGWRMLGELTGKESIAVAQHIPVEGTKEWNDERLNEVVASLSEEDPNAILPDDAFELTNSQVAKLLARIWETYGQLLAPDNFWDVIFIKSLSKRLIRQLRHLCARLGIWCAAHTSLYNIETDTRYIPLVTAHISSFYAFMEKIAPFVRSEAGIAQLQRAGELHTEWEWPRLNNWYRTPGTPVPTNSDFLANDILWDPIYSIDYIGEKQTYDLTVPDTHNFVANDFIVHNSHAADYAVLTCQTAFLKCHYPHEYMTALMSVHRDDSAKVSLFAADCQRLGIQVLPPDVNASLLDFHVEKKPDGTRAIRFGLAAVKNVGVGPLEQIIHCRDEGGPFRDLDDFCHRCDLRIVQKRALESLIRVGALDAFGKRHVLLAILDRMMSFSADYHKAKEAGQMSLFGDSTGVNAEDSLLSHLPDIPDVPYREQLRWEKELVGLYVSSHPLQAVLGHITDLAASGISTTSEIIEAGDEINGRTVQIVGLVTEVRSIITKKGDAMAILNIEDITGTVSAVMFPRTWTEYRKQVAEDVILKITGKADTSRGDVQIVVDAVTQKIEVSQAADALPNLNAMRLDWMDDDPPVSNGNGNGHTPAPEPPRREERAPAPAAQQITDREAPPEDYDYEPEWDSPIVEPIEEHHENGRSTPPPAPAAKTRDQMPTAPIAEPVQYRPRRKSEPKAPPPPPPQGRLLTLIVERTGDSDQDRRRMANLHGYLIQFPGHDHFSFMLTGNNQKRVRIDYPKHPIDINDEMLTYLVRKLGAENVIVE
jgi:DNA polymerase-3 subunit alpha